MPELPEVETVVRGLRKTVLGRTIARVRSKAPAGSIVVGDSLGRRSFAALLEGRRILRLDRRGKNILMPLSGGLTLWVHLKMTGHLFYISREEPVDKHDLVLIDFIDADRNHHLRFNDYRRFGRLRLYTDDELWQQPGLADLGPEPLQISAADFVTRCRSARRMIKPALLDQTFLAGLGNIYTDESLYLARLHPRRRTDRVSPAKLRELHGHIRKILKRSIRLLGTTVAVYSGVDGQSGRFQKQLKVYGREGDHCCICGGRIVREKIGSRSAHFCPRCQRAKG
jgi:formamidopyrimidine-DNA glycosylase